MTKAEQATEISRLVTSIEDALHALAKGDDPRSNAACASLILAFALSGGKK